MVVRLKTYRLQTDTRRVIICIAHDFFVPVGIDELCRHGNGPVQPRLVLQAKEDASGEILPDLAIEAALTTAVEGGAVLQHAQVRANERTVVSRWEMWKHTMLAAGATLFFLREFTRQAT